MQKILHKKEDIRIILERARKEALKSLQDYSDHSFAKVKTELYDLDTFIHRFSTKRLELSNVKPYMGSGYDQRQIIEEVNQSIDKLLEDLNKELDKSKSKNEPGKKKPVRKITSILRK